MIGDWGLGIEDFGFWILDFGFWILDFGLGEKDRHSPSPPSPHLPVPLYRSCRDVKEYFISEQLHHIQPPYPERPC
jgi:hypothetical protein